MLFIFRKLRRSFFLPGKVRTYMAYAVGEIVLIVVGIMIALEANEWKEERRDRIEEKEILRRISKEVDLGITGMRSHLDNLQSKQEALNRIAVRFEERTIGDTMRFLADVTTASNFGWSYPETQKITFEEFQGTGKLGLIQNVELRTRIVKYYHFAYTVERMAHIRTGEFSNIVYDLIPHDRGSFLGIKEGLLDSEYVSIADSVLESDLHLQMNREENRAAFLERRWEQYIEDGNELVDLIKAELANN